MTAEIAVQLILTKIAIDGSKEFLVSKGIPEKSIHGINYFAGKPCGAHLDEFLALNMPVIGEWTLHMLDHILEVKKKADDILKNEKIFNNNIKLHEFKF